MNYIFVSYRDPYSDSIVSVGGVLYKQNVDFLVLYYMREEGDVSWSRRFSFIVVPTRFIVEGFELKEGD